MSELAKISDQERMTSDQLTMLADTIMKGATADEMKFFGEVCAKHRLDPFKRQIHAVKRWDSDARRMVWSYQTGIDGYRAIANRTGLYAGSDEPKYLPADESAANPTKATVTVWKIVAGQRVAFTASARWNEYVQTKKDKTVNSMWSKMPYGQLAKCAEALALRKAFPEEVGGLLTDVEMHQADNEDDRKDVHNPNQPNLESQKFETEPEPQPEPEKTEPDPEPEPIEAEVVESLAIPDVIQPWIKGKWKKPMGVKKVADIPEARTNAFEGDDPEKAAQACASIYDEVQKLLEKAGKGESDLAVLCIQKGIEMDFPADLWNNPKHYVDILDQAKTLK